MNHANRYKSLLAIIREKAESKFDANFVMGRKNVILLRRRNPREIDRPFMTIKANFHDQSFHDGDYDISYNPTGDARDWELQIYQEVDTRRCRRLLDARTR